MKFWLRLAYFLMYLYPISFAQSIDHPTSHDATSPTTTNLTNIPWRCWSGPNPRLTTTNLEDCRIIAVGIQSMKPHGRPLNFGTEGIRGNDYLVPFALSARTCKLTLLPLSTEAPVQDAFTARYFAHTINRMVQECVIPYPHLGGEGPIGKKGVLGFAIAGLVKPAPPGAIDQLAIEQGLKKNDSRQTFFGIQ